MLQHISGSVVIGLGLFMPVTLDSNVPQAEKPAPLKLVQTIALPNVEGRIDHLAVDLRRNHLFIAALGNNTVEVVDLKAGARVHSITGLREPQGIGYLPKLDHVYVANGQGEGVDILEAGSYRKINSVKLGDDSDNVRIDTETMEVVVGYGSGALAFIYGGDTPAVRHRVQLPGHPESFQIDHFRGLVYVNVPSAKAVVVCDRKESKPLKFWVFSAAEKNFPMALDAEHNVLFVACRQPARLLFFDTKEGALKMSTDTVADADDVFYDSALNRVYVIGGGGSVEVYECGPQLILQHLGSVSTAAGARTGLFVPALRRLYVAVPHRGAQAAEIRVFETVP